jgi:hypothetical protein
LVKKSRLAALAAAAAACCLPLPDAYGTSKASAVLPLGIGVTMGIHEFYTEAAADQMMQRVHDSGLNAVRLVILWNHDYLPHSRDTHAICFAARAAEARGLRTLIIGLEPSKSVWPFIQDDLELFDNAIGNIDQGLFDAGSNCLTRPSSLRIVWMIGNEPNVETFCDGSDKGLNPPVGMLAEHQECAAREALLLHSSYAFIQADERKYGVELPVIGGALSSNDAPFDFLGRFCEARKTLGYKAADMDYFGFHPYADGPADGPYYGLKLEPRLAATLRSRQCFGRSVPVVYTEIGYETEPPPDKGYTGSAARSAFVSSEANYPSLFRHALRMTVSQGVAGYFNMLLDDEQCLNPGWQSGWYYWDRSPKPFLPEVEKLLTNLAA